jgi:hypothetical protein
MRRVLGIATLAACLAAAPRPAHAQNDAGAESLFQDARKLMDAKRYAEACPKFLASEKLSPAIGTLLNLADCYEKNGQLASAWARFHEAMGLAQRLGRSDREKTARERAERLEPRLIKLTISSQEKTALDVKLDGNALDTAALGTAIPVDPGKHTIEASAKNKKPFTTSIDVTERSKSPSVEIPALEDVPHAADTGPKEEPTPKQPTPPEKDGSTQRTLGIAAMGAGVVGVGVGAFFGLQTSSKWSDAKNHCNGVECDATGVQLATDAKNAGNISTIAFIAGGVLLAGGAALFFTAPVSDVKVGVGPGNVVVGGRF